jgi:glycosyltransferase involved in cell wall biosynthesis
MGVATPEPLVSVVIPAHGRAELMTSTLRSVHQQRYKNIEVVVVDDGSPDPLREAILRELPSATILRNERALGVSAARNLGFAATRGELVAFLDDDDLWAPDKVVAQVRALQASPERGWCVTGAVEIDDRLKIVRATHASNDAGSVSALLRGNTVGGGGSAVMASRELIDQVGAFDEKLSVIEDWDLWLRMAQVSDAVLVDRPLVAWRLHGGNESLRARGSEELERFLENHAATYAQFATEFDRSGWYQWEGESLLRGGHRLKAAARFTRAGVSDRSWRTWRRVGVALCHPDPAAAFARRRVRGEDVAWCQEVEDWLMGSGLGTHALD